MAYAVLVSLTQTIHEILQDHDQYSISLHDKQHIISIHEYIIFLQAFLENFPEKAKSLEGQMRDVANKAEDIIEDVKRKEKHHFNFPDQLEKVTGEIDSIARDVMDIKNSARSIDHTCFATSSSPSSSRLITAPATGKDIAMVGFEDDLMAIKGRLCGESSKLQVIPIFGMGGIGKTTLARNAYDDPLSVEHFHIRAWVTVSQDYSAKEIVSSLLVSASAPRPEENEQDNSEPRKPSSLLISVGQDLSEESDESKIGDILYKILKGRRYLIVMDDIWSTEVWDDVRNKFPNDHNGSRILLTTRLSDVAAYPDSSSPLHEMHFMDPDQSWNLLCWKVFKQEQCPLELENIGKEIARRCRGLPLATVVIAGLLSTVGPTQDNWEKIAKNVNEIVATNDEQFADIVLSMSYNHLPQYLKPCFLYIGGFPEDYEINASKLIKLFVAEGFLKLPNGPKSCEEIAEEYLEDLVKRSLVLVNTRKCNGKIKSCSVHDLVRHLCIRKAQEEKFFLHVNDSHAQKILAGSIQDLRRLSIQHVIDPYVSLRKTYGRTSVRTVLYFQRRESLSGISENLKFETLSGISESFRLLRVLDAVYIRFREFPVEVLELFHLKYLSFTCIGRFDFHIPAAMSKLENLQTLIICPYYKMYKYISNGVHFPSEIWRMSQLRHIVVFSLDSLPSEHALRNLQTLAQVTDFQCTERMVQMVPNLKKLAILYKGKHGIEWRVYQLHNLVHMHQLEELKIWAEDHNGCISFWENLAFPRMLKKLNLSGFHFGWQDIAVVGSLPNLEVLKLRFCSFEEDEWKTSEGEFCRLKFLQIRFGYLQRWITESSHFPRLEHLQLYGCSLLGEIPDGIREIPPLELIEVDERTESLLESAKRIQEEQHSYGNDALQVRLMREWQFPIYED